MTESKSACTEDNSLIFEYPLAERMRGFLRLEAAFAKARARMKTNQVAADRATLDCLLELAGLTDRSELKREVLSELERQQMLLDQLANSTEVDAKRLNQAAYVLEQTKKSVSALPQQLGLPLKSNEFLSALRSRSTIPGGTCDFDLPALHFWLAQPEGARKQDLEHWITGLAPVEEALTVLLEHTRQAAAFEPAQAPDGIHEYNPSKKQPPSLLRIRLNSDRNLYPQISGSRHRVTIQFQHWRGINERPELLRRDIDFDLAICRL